MQRHERLAFWGIAVAGLLALGGVVWDAVGSQPDAPLPTPPMPAPGGGVRSLAELALAPEANANNGGVRLASEGKLDQAVECFRSALQRDPDYLPGHKNLLAALVESRRWPEALAAAREAEAVHPLLKAVVSRQGAVGSELQTLCGEPEAASTAEGDSAQSLAESADAEHADGKRDHGERRDPKPAARLRVPDDPEVRAALYKERDFIANCARAYLENGLLEEAEARFLLHVQLCPNEVKGYNGLAEIALRRGHPDDSVRLFAISLRTYGDQPDVVAKLNKIAANARSTSSGQGAELAANVQWVLANYLEPKRQRPEMPAGVAPLKLPSARTRDWDLPIRNPEPVLELPTAPVPELPQAPAPNASTP